METPLFPWMGKPQLIGMRKPRFPWVGTPLFPTLGIEALPSRYAPRSRPGFRCRLLLPRQRSGVWEICRCVDLLRENNPHLPAW